jgi:hypothetical protein
VRRAIPILLAFLVATSVASGATPVITSLNPSSIVAGNPDFTLQVTGANFTLDTQVRIDNAPRPVEFVNSTTVRATIPAFDVAVPRTFSVTALNPGFPASGAVTFQVVSNVPSITSISPSNVTVGSGNVTITVAGGSFASTAVVRLNNVAIATTFVSEKQLTAVVPSSELTSPRSINVTVFNPHPFNKTSNTVTLQVSAALPPSISALDPNSVVAGSDGFTLAVVGTNFAANSIIRIDNVSAATTFVNSSRLTTEISASRIATAKTLTITVLNPTANLTSGPATLTVTEASIPIVQSITPTSVEVGSGALTMAVTGNKFNLNSVVRFDGSERSTTFIDSRHLNASLTATDISREGTHEISVLNRPPNGGTSNSLLFTVFAADAPIINSLSPAAFATNEPTLKLTVTGSRFGLNNGDEVLVDGSPRVTEFVSETTLVATLLPSDVAAPGTHTVTVRNKFGRTSGPLTFTVATQAGPVVTSIEPSTAAVGDAPFTLTVNGTNFVGESIITIDGVPRDTTFVSPERLTVQITAADLSSPRIVAVAVLNPGGPTSAAVNLTVNLVPPTISALAPAQAIAGENNKTVTLSGTGFAANSVVKVVGVTRPSTFDASAGTLTIELLGEDLLSPRSIPITVTGVGGTSSPVSFTVVGPVITAVTPLSIVAGSDNVLIRVEGTGFLPTSQIVFADSVRATTFDDGVLTTILSGINLGITGRVSVRVRNSSDSFSSGFLIDVVSPGAPRIERLDPATIVAGSGPLDVTIIGANFLFGAVAKVNDTNRPTRFVSTTELVVSLEADDLALPGALILAVTNPDLTATPSIQLTITAPQVGGRRRAVGR